MRKRVTFVLLLVSLGLVVFASGCAEYFGVQNQLTLNDLQISICKEASSAGTCQTRMLDLGVVLPSECCSILSKCC